MDFLKENKDVRITLSLSKAGYYHSECGKLCNSYDMKKRCWRHLDTCQYANFIEADDIKQTYTQKKLQGLAFQMKIKFLLSKQGDVNYGILIFE